MKIRNQLNTRIIQKMKGELLVIASSLAAVAVIVCLTIYFNLGRHDDAVAAGGSYSSSATGNWSSAGTWNGGAAPPVSLNGDAITVNSNHSVTLNGNLTAQNGSAFIIYANGVLRIEGDMEVKNNMVLTVHGQLIVTGNLIGKNGANIDINGGGVITTGGNVQLENNADFKVDGTLNVGGDLTFGANPVFNGSGNVNIAGTGCNRWSGSGSCNQNIVLPITLLKFEAIYSANTVLLLRKTATELNNDLFTIERSSNGIDYYFLTSVKGKGTTKRTSDYQYIDSDPLNGISYYRLSQKDYDGTITTFKPISVKISMSSAASFTVSPNPLTGTTVNLSFTEPEEGTIQIVDANGNLILTEETNDEDYNKPLQLGSDLPSGFYYVKYITDASVSSVKLVKR